MRMPDIDELLPWLFTVIMTLAVLCLGGFGIAAGLRWLSESHERDACGHDGGKVDYYDAQHADLWRCIKPAERAP